MTVSLVATPAGPNPYSEARAGPRCIGRTLGSARAPCRPAVLAAGLRGGFLVERREGASWEVGGDLQHSVVSEVRCEAQLVVGWSGPHGLQREQHGEQGGWRHLGKGRAGGRARRVLSGSGVDQSACIREPHHTKNGGRFGRNYPWACFFVSSEIWFFCANHGAKISNVVFILG